MIELSAPGTGRWRAFSSSRIAAPPPERNFEFSSNSARKLLGTIYLPRGIFKGGGRRPGRRSLSAYTIIVANRIELDGGKLVINADYAASDVPVPLGLGNNPQVRLDRLALELPGTLRPARRTASSRGPDAGFGELMRRSPLASRRKGPRSPWQHLRHRGSRRCRRSWRTALSISRFAGIGHAPELALRDCDCWPAWAKFP